MSLSGFMRLKVGKSKEKLVKVGKNGEKWRKCGKVGKIGEK